MKNDNIDDLTFESLHAEITCNSRSFRLVNIYRPERYVDGKHVNFSSFLQEFDKLIVNYLLHPSDIILIGDFNIHMDNTINIYANQFKDWCCLLMHLSRYIDGTHSSNTTVLTS